MRRWDEYNLYTTVHYASFPLTDSDIEHGVFGKGLARILGLCKPLRIADCPAAPQNTFTSHEPVPAGGPRLELLSGASGAPNVVAFYVNRVQSQSAKEMDDSYVGMRLVVKI